MNALDDAVAPMMKALDVGRTDIIKRILEQAKKVIDDTYKIPPASEEENDAKYEEFVNKNRNEKGNFMFNAAMVRGNAWPWEQMG
jgi:hypothetical protein